MLRIGIAYSLKPEDRGEPADGPDDRYEEFDKPETIEALAEAIRGDGHDVSLLGDGREFLAKMLANPPDFVFNFAEGQGVGRDREARVPAVCEMLGVPYSGSDPLTMAVALDKGAAKRLVYTCDGMRIPAGLRLPPGLTRGDAIREVEDSYVSRVDEFDPVILKPSFEGSSKGVRGRCLAWNTEEVADRYVELAAAYHQEILIEQYIEGDEVTVGVIGNGQAAEILGLMRITPKVPTDYFVYSLEVKRDYINQVDYEAPAAFPFAIRRTLEHAALSAFLALGCRDVARIDYRIDSQGHCYFLEANPLPGLAPITSDLVILAEGYGISHASLVRMILHTALERVGLRDSGARS